MIFIALLLGLSSLSLQAETSSSINIADFIFQVQPHPPHLRISKFGQVLWESAEDGGFFEVGSMDVRIQDKRAHFYMSESFVQRCQPERLTAQQSQLGVLLEGPLTSVAGNQDCGKFQITFRVQDPETLSFTATSHKKDHNYIKLRSKSHRDEAFFGFGVQPSFINLKGHALPILSQEQGIGRGASHGIFSLLLSAFGFEGSPHHSYIAAPHYVSSDMKSFYLHNSEYSYFDLRAEDSVDILLHSGKMEGSILYGKTPLDLVSAYTRFSGRMKPLPNWLNEGAIIGLQGGNAKVERVLSQLLKAGTPIAAVWLQDWVGTRKTIVGKQLWWNWDVDKNSYDWGSMQAFLAKHSIRLMGYINPMLVDIPFGEEGVQRSATKKNYYQEFYKKGLLVTQADNQEAYLVKNTDFDAGLLDLTRDATRQAIKKIIKQKLIGQGMSGWMADYGEALPFDAKLFDGSDPKTFHNIYPVAWAQVNLEAIQEAGRSSDIIFFNRSGFSQSPGVSRLFWLGDQTVTWDRFDGLHSSIIGLMGGGFSGFSLNHSDIGGYATSGFFGIVRREELMLRWIETNAFTPAFRTHEGNQPEENIQLDGSQKILDSFAKFAGIYKDLAPYRRQLFQAAFSKGYPLVRHPFLHYPGDTQFYHMDSQFLLGPSLMVAPILKKGQRQRRVYLPPGTWLHLWSGQCFSVTTTNSYEVDAKLGAPPVFLLDNPILRKALRKHLPSHKPANHWYNECFGSA